MNKNYSINEIGSLLDQSSEILVCLPEKVVFDQVASGLSLFLALEKMGKKVSIASSSTLVVEFSHLVGLDQIKSKIDGHDLVISIPIEKVDKVKSEELNGRLNLIIQAKPGMISPTQEEIIFSSTGAQAQMIFVIGATKLEDLGAFYQENLELFESGKVININNQPSNFGLFNIVDLQASSISEMMVSLIEGLNLPFDAEMANNLFLGLRAATNNFISKQVTADTFEAAAICLRISQSTTLPPVEEQPHIEEVKTEETPADWLEPKIYKGTSIS